MRRSVISRSSPPWDRPSRGSEGRTIPEAGASGPYVTRRAGCVCARRGWEAEATRSWAGSRRRGDEEPAPCLACSRRIALLRSRCGARSGRLSFGSCTRSRARPRSCSSADSSGGRSGWHGLPCLRSAGRASRSHIRRFDLLTTSIFHRIVRRASRRRERTILAWRSQCRGGCVRGRVPASILYLNSRMMSRGESEDEAWFPMKF